MKTLMVIESWFGNTREVGTAIAEGLRGGGAEIETINVVDAPEKIPEDIDLVVVGAPTHNRGLSTAKTRESAYKDAEDASGSIDTGAREWLNTVSAAKGVRIAVFDTCTSKSWLSGSAAKAAEKLLNRRQPGVSIARKTFLVGGAKGPLQSGQVEEAKAWGKELTTG